jgi:hypothetical protein
VAKLLGFSVFFVLAAARTELLEGQSIWIVALIFLRVIVALATIGASQGNQDAVSFFGHLAICLV